MTASVPTMHRARWLLGNNGQLLENAVVTFAGRRIVAVERFAKAKHESAFDWGDRLLTPLFVNAHTHLEFSELTAPLGHAGMEFSQWIRQVLLWRVQSTAQSDGGLAHGGLTSPSQKGLQLSQQSGVGLLADIVSTPWSVEYFRQMIDNPDVDLAPQCPLVQPYLEQLGAKPTQATERWETVTKRLDQLGNQFAKCNNTESKLMSVGSPANPTIGLSPHAPYSTSSELFQKIVSTAQDRRLPLAMHVAESLSERQLLEHGSGPFRDLLEQLNLWPGAKAFPSISQIIEGIAGTGTPGLIVHGNYLTDSEMKLIARHQSTLSVVYCPRTHAYFNHQAYPLRQLLDLGINVGVGTDSLASNPDLDLLGELRMIYRRHTDISPKSIWRLGTAGGSQALGYANDWGQLARGFCAGAICWDLGSADLNHPLESLLAQSGTVSRTIIASQSGLNPTGALQK